VYPKRLVAGMFVRCFYVLYSFLIAIVVLMLYLALPFLFFRKWRKAVLERLGRFSFSSSPASIIWFHAVSAGEVAAAAMVFRSLVEKQSEIKAVVTTNTAAGRAIARRDFPRGTVLLRPPLDSVRILNRFIRKTGAVKLVILEIELWPVLVTVAARGGLRPFLCNARMPDADFSSYWRFRFLFKKILSSFDFIGAQDLESSLRYRQLGAVSERMQVVGNVKYDLVPPRRAEVSHVLPERGLIIVIGSSHPEEEDFFIECIKVVLERISNAIFIIAPRDVRRGKHIFKKAVSSGIPAFLRTDGVQKIESGQILVLDTIGELASVYDVATVAVVGGSWSRKVQGHNPLEAAVCGVPVVFGPKMENFRGIAADLLHSGGGLLAEDGAALFRVIVELLQNPVLAGHTGTNARQTVAEGRGAANKYAELLLCSL